MSVANGKNAQGFDSGLIWIKLVDDTSTLSFSKYDCLKATKNFFIALLFAAISNKN